MKPILHKSIILAIAVAAVLVASGCNEQNLSNEKMHRLIANENRHLKDQLDQCLHDKNALDEQMRKHIQELSDGAIKDLEEIAKLREENEKLKTKVASLEAQ